MESETGRMPKVARVYCLCKKGIRHGVIGIEIPAEWLDKHGEEELKRLFLKRGYEFKEWFI